MNPVTHFEIPYKKAERVSEFYRKVFGWEINPLGPNMNHYILVTTAKSDTVPNAPSGSINGGLFLGNGETNDQHPSVVMGVEDIEASMALIEKYGGEIIGEPHEIPGFGLYISFRDTEGNRLSILEPKM